MMLNDVWIASNLSLKGEILPRLLVCEATSLHAHEYQQKQQQDSQRSKMKRI